MITRLNSVDLNSVLEILENYKFEQKTLENLKDSSGYIEDKNVINSVLDVLADELVARGFLKEEPTPYGLKIENLITFYSNILIHLTKVRK